MKNSLIWGVKCEKFNLGKLLADLRKAYLSRKAILKFLLVLKQEKILGNICFSEQTVYTKKSLGDPDLTLSCPTITAFAERHPKLVARKNRDFSRRTSK